MRSAAATNASADKTTSRGHYSPDKTNFDRRHQANSFNPVWHGLATYIEGPGPASVQRMCEDCEEEAASSEGLGVQARLTLGAVDDGLQTPRGGGETRIKNLQEADTGTPEESQGRLLVAGADDPLEKEAREAAQDICTHCTAGSTPQPAVRQSIGGAYSSASAARLTDSVRRSIAAPGAGAPMSLAMRERIEPTLNTDLSSVRVHDDPNAQAAASDLRAKAFTYGAHIFLGEGQSAGDLALMAHESVHIAQKDVAGDLVLRNPEDEEEMVCEPEDEPWMEPSNEPGGDSGSQADIPRPPPPQRQREADVGTIFSTLPERTEQEQGDLNTILDAYELYRTIEQKEAMERRFHYEGRRGMGIVRYTSHNQQVMQRIQNEINREVHRLGLPDEQVAKTLIRQRMPTMVLRRGKQAAIALLNENERMARAEMARYAESVCSPDIDGLLYADRELEARHSAMQSTENDINRASMYMSAVPAGVPETAADYGIPPNEGSIMYVITRIDEYRESLQNQRREYEQMRSRFGQVYPVLLAEGYEPGRFSSAPTDQLSQLTAQPLQEIIDNIHRVKEAVNEDEMKVWNMHQVLEIAIADMRIGGFPEYMEIVHRRIQSDQDASFVEAVKAALAITTTLIAGVIGGPLGATLVGGAWGTYFFAESAGRYFLELAAENIAMDPEVRDISINEPELIWVVIDAVGLGLDVGAFVRIVRPIARAALQTRRIAEFSQAVRRLAPARADRLITSLRRRLGREAINEGTGAGAAVRALGEGRTLDEYLQALRSEQHGAGTVGRSWDYQNQSVGLSDAQWRPGDPIDMPNTRGTYPAYDKARGRYWRNRAHFELEARARGEARYQPGVTTDPVSGLTDDQLRRMRDSGRAPEYAYGNRPGQTWELEHHGVPQRVGRWLRELGFDQPGEASRLIEASRPGSLMEATPLEHAFWDVEAHGFGSLRADIEGAHWVGTAMADVRRTRPLYYMSDDTIRDIVNRAAREGMDFSRNARTGQLRAALEQEITERGLGLTLP